ncbi:MAG TPA: glycosyl hydrolase [Acidimicrobiales bacterium]
METAPGAARRPRAHAARRTAHGAGTRRSARWTGVLTSRRARGLVAGLVTVGTLATVAATQSATAASGPAPPHAATSSTLSKPAVPRTSAYLGAFVAPHEAESQAQADVRQELAQIGNFDGTLGRPLGLIHVYQPWSAPVKSSVLAALAATGATPVVDWTCTSDASIVNGSQDTLITSYADTLKAYGRPVFLRWFWEMNLVSLPRTAGCLGTLGATGYIQAWQHIWTIFQNRGAANVAFVWCPSINGATFGSAYYPGDSYVDWIGWDGYDRRQDPAMLTTQFLPFYANWITHGKPLMLGETGATIDQGTYLAQLTSVLPVTFPGLKAVLYYDSKSTSDWTLADTPGQLGLSAFTTMGQTPYFGFPFVGS